VSQVLVLRNHQRERPINTRQLRQMLETFLAPRLIGRSVAVHLVGATKMAELNQQWLSHEGATDVITFDYKIADGARQGEIFVCVDEAIAQAPRFRSTWQQETVRYILHGFLHLAGHDDQTPAARKKMKVEENKLVREFFKQAGWKQAFLAQR
jgi:probable rRNA maturation factor